MMHSLKSMDHNADSVTKVKTVNAFAILARFRSRLELHI